MNPPPTSLPLLLLLLAALTALTTAQLLTNGNSQLPSCATTCPLLLQAAQACSGTTTATAQTWSCFCQSGYLTTLYTSPAGICDGVCTSASDAQQVMTWFTTNCGTDDGVAEHAGSGSGGGGTTVVVITSTSTSAPATAAATATGTGAALPSTTASGGTAEPDVRTSSGKTWWDGHWKWVLMLIILFVALLLLALLATYLKRRHDRRADQIREGFNTGITTRSAPMTMATAPADTAQDATDASGGGGMGPSGYGSGRNSPAPHRAREAVMPYSYTRVGELEKEVGMLAPEGAPPAKRTRRVLVREGSVEGAGSPEVEKM
ncbi:hypothetical protein B0A55_09495 [Friedmanniomyces simplex]|uniref:Integral membrane protein n=1 Tax=Friedmanniomyces simplex TaxID=329884 RepID=A0A4U0XAE8_9PEZI|nr:hypothetical protein B0A55_09495 [Friedmanniomyces simplex]